MRPSYQKASIVLSGGARVSKSNQRLSDNVSTKPNSGIATLYETHPETSANPLKWEVNLRELG